MVDNVTDMTTEPESSSYSDISLDETDDEETTSRQLLYDECAIAEAERDNYENSLNKHANVAGHLARCLSAILERSWERRYRSEISRLSLYRWHSDNALNMMELTHRILCANTALRVALGQTHRSTGRFVRLRRSLANSWLDERLRDDCHAVVALFDRTWLFCGNELIIHCVATATADERWTLHNNSVLVHLRGVVNTFTDILDVNPEPTPDHPV